jgi:hypothetical protein
VKLCLTAGFSVSLLSSQPEPISTMPSDLLRCRAFRLTTLRQCNVPARRLHSPSDGRPHLYTACSDAITRRNNQWFSAHVCRKWQLRSVIKILSSSGEAGRTPRCPCDRRITTQSASHFGWKILQKNFAVPGASLDLTAYVGRDVGRPDPALLALARPSPGPGRVSCPPVADRRPRGATATTPDLRAAPPRARREPGTST